MRYFAINFKYVWFLFLVVFSLTCKKTDRNDKKYWIGKELILPEVTSNEVKVVLRLIGDYPSCVKSISSLRKFYDIAKLKNKGFKFIVYVEVVDQNKFKELKQMLDFADLVIFDQRNAFFRKNLLKFPFGLEDQMFLLDQKNKIVLIGNPIYKINLISKYIELP